MATAMTCAILILLFVQEERSYDRHFENASDLYRVLENQYYNGSNVIPSALTPSPLAAALKEKYPEIIRSSRYLSLPISLQHGDDYILEVLALVDPDFLTMFNIKFVQGGLKTALSGPHNIVITEKMANKYFGEDDPINKTLTSLGIVFTVTGVVKSLPPNSHIQFDFLVPFEFVKDLGVNINDWVQMPCFSYIELHKGTDSKLVDKKILDFLKKEDKIPNTEIFIQNIKKIHLFSSAKYAGDISGNGDITNVRILSLIAIFILIIACINFINLSTAQSAMRVKEIGLRKVAGASKRKIIVQFLGESLLIVLVACTIAMFLVELLLPDFNNLIGKQLNVNYQSSGLYIGLITIVLFCGLLAGSYPAFYLSSLQPLNIIKGIINKNPGNAGFRRILVIFQFSLSVILIICTLIVGTQLKYIQNKKLGLNIDNIGYFQFSWGMKVETLKKDISNNPNILSVTIAGNNPFSISDSRNGFNWAGKKEGDDVVFHLLSVDMDYANTFQLKLKEGRFFSSEFSTDATAVIINERAAEMMGLKNPIEEIITDSQGVKHKIIGVVKDFHFQSLHTRIEPLIMQMQGGAFCFIKMKPDNIISTVDYIKKTFKSYNLPYPIDFKFLDNDYDNLYQSEQKMGKIFEYFSFLAILISCLGLIGLTSFMTVRRTKEIGIRKVNGAKSIEVFSSLSKEYIVWVFISIIIASPIAWYLMYRWLQTFAYRININVWIFLLAGIIVFVVAFLTVTWQSLRTAMRNPVDALRYE